jgi:hypothetical protein
MEARTINASFQQQRQDLRRRWASTGVCEESEEGLRPELRRSRAEGRRVRRPVPVWVTAAAAGSTQQQVLQGQGEPEKAVVWGG